MVFYILMAVSIGGGLGLAIILKHTRGKTLESRLKAYRRIPEYQRYDTTPPGNAFHFWIPVPLALLFTVIVGLSSLFITAEERVISQETFALAPITDTAYIEAGWCNEKECITYKTEATGYWDKMDNVYASKSTISEGHDTPQVTITTTDLFAPSWWSPWGGPGHGGETNRVTTYDFQVPTGTVAIK